MRLSLRHDGGAAVPDDGDNLVLRAARGLLRELCDPCDPSPEELERAPRTELTLAKRIPVAAGMAGGSADAAATLLALDRLWDVRLGPEALRPIAARLGADVPFCLAGGTALATGTGTQLRLTGEVTLAASTLGIGLDASAADHAATITNPNNAAFRVDNFVDIERDVSSVFVEWRRDSGPGEYELGLRAKRVTANAGQVGASGMMGGMGANVALLAAAFNDADRSVSWNSVDAVAKFRRFDDAGTEWRLEVGSKTRAPSYQELYLWLPLQATGGLADGRSYVGGLGLDVERSHEIAAGFGRRLGRLTLSPEAFYRRVDGYIQGVPSTNMVANMVSQMMSGNPALEFANVDAEIWGVDLAWKIELGDRWYADGTASWARGKRRDVDDNLYRLAPPNASAGLTWQVDRLSLTTEIVAYARQDKVSSYNAERATPGYALANAMLAWNPADSLRLEARVDNLFDRSYQDHVAGINRAGGSDIPVGERLYGSERTLTVGAIWSF